MLTRLIRAYFLTGCPSVVKWLFTIKQLTLDGDGGSEARGALSAATTQLDAWRLWFMWGQLLRWAWHDHRKSVQIVFVFLFVCELVMVHCYEWGDFLLHWSGNYLLLLAIKSGFSMNLIFFFIFFRSWRSENTHTRCNFQSNSYIFSVRYVCIYTSLVLKTHFSLHIHLQTIVFFLAYLQLLGHPLYRIFLYSCNSHTGCAPIEKICRLKRRVGKL